MNHSENMRICYKQKYSSVKAQDSSTQKRIV